MTPPRVPDDVWPYIAKVRDACRLSYKQVGNALGVSESLVKFRLSDRVYYKTPSGRWSHRKRRGTGAEADSDNG